MVKLGSNYLKASDCKTGDRFKFLTEGEFVENQKYTYEDGNPRRDFIIDVDYKGQKRSLRINKTNRDKLIAEFQEDETKNWIGKVVSIEVANALISGKLQPVMILSADLSGGWDE